MEAAAGQSDARGPKRPYRCYLLRCWLEEGAGPRGVPAWRFTLRQTGLDAARLSFTSLHDVAVYIETELVAFARTQQDANPNGDAQGGESEDLQ